MNIKIAFGKSEKIKKVSLLLVLVGVMLILYPPFTCLYARYEQTRLWNLLVGSDQPAQGTPLVTEHEDNPEPEAIGTSSLESSRAGEFKEAIIEIPEINLSAVVVRGTSTAALRKGPGWYEESALPGLGNTAIAGHRTMYGAWFQELERLHPDDQIILLYGGQKYVYRVERVFSVARDDWSVIEPCGYPVLTLTTCHPLGSARQRLVVRAKLVSFE
jgi:sortase A